jgi:hypothetical protein
MILEILLGFFIIAFLVDCYIVWNLMKKTERLEDWVEEYSQKLTDTKTVMDSLDSEGKFESDDEIGTIFEGIKEAVDELNKLTEKDI